ncbi:Hint domain-containing protein [Roseomonas sp. CAU 1739]|uniref:Hint domain-containing protein n=1 Tax=Roseomonas sp. CAU 1739 TaxID=3140364 RepID=UPI00325BA948
MTHGPVALPWTRSPAAGKPACEDPALSGLLPTSMVVTVRGERQVDELEAGDIVVVLACAGYRPVQRVVETIVDLARRPDAAPVRIAEGAFDRFSPNRTTIIAPHTLVGVDDWLVPIVALVNGRSIRTVPMSGVVRYLQLEMGDHDMIVADGLRTGTLRRGTEPCRPLLTGGATLERLRARLADRIPALEEAGLLAQGDDR